MTCLHFTINSKRYDQRSNVKIYIVLNFEMSEIFRKTFITIHKVASLLWDITWYSWPSMKFQQNISDSKVHVANMGPTYVLVAPVGPTLAPWILLLGISNSCALQGLLTDKQPQSAGAGTVMTKWDLYLTWIDIISIDFGIYYCETMTCVCYSHFIFNVPLTCVVGVYCYFKSFII